MFTPRQQQVLTAALELLVLQGDRLTMTSVARRASCSKETLYKWFGDRDGLLTATVQFRLQGADAAGGSLALDAVSLRQSIEQLPAICSVRSWAGVGDANRLAINHAAPKSTDWVRMCSSMGRSNPPASEAVLEADARRGCCASRAPKKLSQSSGSWSATCKSACPGDSTSYSEANRHARVGRPGAEHFLAIYAINQGLGEAAMAPPRLFEHSSNWPNGQQHAQGR